MFVPGRVSRGAVVIGVVLSLAGCGETSGREQAQGGDSGGGSGGAAAGSNAAGANVSGSSFAGSGASSAQSGGGGSAESDAGLGGEAGMGGMPNVEPCSGELTGGWVAIDDDAAEPPDPMVDSCWNLKGEYSDGTYFASTRYPSANRLSTYVKFRSDGTYLLLQVRSGPITLSYAPECLVTPQGTPTCAELQDALTQSRLGEGSYRDTMCSARAGGGCDCAVRVEAIGGAPGYWRVDEVAKTVTMSKLEGAPEPREVTVGYCADASGLRFDTAIGGWWPGTANETFLQVDCQDGLQGPGELGVDCGHTCPTSCP
jgi:hypothetical protein